MTTTLPDHAAQPKRYSTVAIVLHWLLALVSYDDPMLKREVCGGDVETTIDRTRFDVNYGIDWGFPKNVRLLIQVEAVKQ